VLSTGNNIPKVDGARRACKMVSWSWGRANDLGWDMALILCVYFVVETQSCGVIFLVR
jgi:hypothetical protein